MTDSNIEVSIDMLLAQVCHLHYHRAHQLLEAIGLYRGQPPVLRALWEQEGQTQRELSDRLKITPATLTKMLQRMERTGFIERQPDEIDQRVTRVYLTEHGRTIQAEVKKVWFTMETETFAHLDGAQLNVLRSCLEQARANLIQVTGGNEWKT